MKSKLTPTNSTRQENRKVAEICIRILLAPVLVMATLYLTKVLSEFLAGAAVQF